MILADIARRFQEACTGDFSEQCRSLDAVVDRLRKGLRERLLADDRICTISPDAQPDARPLVASDGASFEKPYLPLSVGLVLSARGNSDLGFDYLERALPLPAIHHSGLFVRAARLADELQLLLKLPDDQIGILDGSFWTALTEANQLIYALVDLRDEMPRDLYSRGLDEYVRELTRGGEGSKKSLLRQVLEKPNVIAISKRGVTHSICRDGKYFDLFRCSDENGERALNLPDRAVMSYALKAGEYLTPAPLATGNFGCHTDDDFGFPHADKTWFRNHFKSGIYQTFWKPHDNQPAYRIEYHASGYTGDDLMSLFAAIREATTCVRVVEPLPQFMADYVAKNVSRAGRFFEGFISANFPNIRPFRTVV